RPGELEAEARLVSIDYLLAVRDRECRFGSDVGAHHRERGLELEELVGGHPLACIGPVGVVLRLVPEPDRISDAEQATAEARLCMQDLLPVRGERVWSFGSLR